MRLEVGRFRVCTNGDLGETALDYAAIAAFIVIARTVGHAAEFVYDFGDVCCGRRMWRHFGQI